MSENYRSEWLAPNLARLMDDRGISNAKLAERLGIKRQAVHQWRSGANYPNRHNGSALCVILDCTRADLVNEAPASAASEFVPLKTWATENGVTIAHARDMVTYGIITGVKRTSDSINVPKDTPCPEDSRYLVRMAKIRPPWVPVFHTRFPTLLKTAGITSGVLSKKIGVTAGAVLHWVHARNYPERERLPDIARVLNVTVLDLAGTV